MKGLFLFFIACFLYVNSGKAGEDFIDFPEIKDWKIAEEIQTFNPETLFEYINGAADLFLIYDFQVANVATYVGQIGNIGENPEIDVEVYDQKTPLNAYGMYSQERPSKPEFVELGAQAYKEGSMLNFISGRYYVKIDSHDISQGTIEAILSIAQKLSTKLSDKPALPELLGIFPENEKIANTDMYISNDFLGHGFLTNVFRTDYQGDKQKYSLFLISKDSKGDCIEILKKYHEFCKKPGKKIIEGEFKLSDRYNGDIILKWNGNYIWGLMSREKIKKASDKLESLETSLRNLKLIE